MVKQMATLAVGLAACTAHNPDYSPMVTGCTAGERTCSGGRPVECDASGDCGTLLANARCPAGGGCANGRCIPPMPAHPCQRDADCMDGLVCTPFVDQTGVQLAGFCVAPEGVTPGGEPCTAARECRSDLCVSTGGMGSRQECLLACQGDGDCPSSQKCRKYSVTLTGVKGTIKGCGPP